MAALTQSLTFTGQRVVSRAQQAPKRASVVTKAGLKHADELLETAVRETLVSGKSTERARDRGRFRKFADLGSHVPRSRGAHRRA